MPFLGGGAVFLHLASKNMISAAYISDTNEKFKKEFNTSACQGFVPGFLWGLKKK